MQDDNPKKPMQEVIVGEDLSTLSVDELEERVRLLHSEIERTREAIEDKSGSLAAADALFSN